MVNDRKGFDRKEFVQEVKENTELVKFVKSLTKEEIQRIKEVRQFDTILPGTNTYKIAVLCDSLRQNLSLLKSTMAKRLWTIDNLQNNIHRLKVQLASENITETMKGGLVMNEFEINSLIKHNEWLKDGEFNALFAILGNIRANVGQPDLSGNIFFTVDEFNKYVDEIAIYLKKHDYDLFGELND